jgi:hypothetical protein
MMWLNPIIQEQNNAMLPSDNRGQPSITVGARNAFHRKNKTNYEPPAKKQKANDYCDIVTH